MIGAEVHFIAILMPKGKARLAILCGSCRARAATAWRSGRDRLPVQSWADRGVFAGRVARTLFL